MSIRFKQWSTRHNFEQLLSLLTRWFVTETGAKLLSQQRQCVTEALSRCFGYHLLQLSVDSSIELYTDCRIQKKYRAHPFSKQSDVRANFDALPFVNESLDAVIIHHVHEFADSPHQVLREVQRIVVPNGQVIVIGFNPLSVLGLYSCVAGVTPNSIWQNRLISCGRMQDWLSLLDFDVSAVEYGCHHPEILESKASPWLKEKLRYWPLGNFYIISAVKRVSTVIPMKMRWSNPNKHFAGLSSIKPQVSELSQQDQLNENTK